MRNSKLILILAAIIVVALVMTIVINNVKGNTPEQAVDQQVSGATVTDADAPEGSTTAPAMPATYMIENVEVIPQTELKAGCETYACTMLLHILGFDIDEFTFADNYLITGWVYYDEDGTMYGPDMYSAFAGTAYAGWGVYAPAMAKSMNSYLEGTDSKLRAYSYEDIPLESLCEEYVSKGVPVMIWATTGMLEPYVQDTWTVSYVDENAKTEIGDSFSWYAHEHCLVLIGYDEENYYFADSAAGEISVFKKDLVAKRYEQLFSQCIVVK